MKVSHTIAGIFLMAIFFLSLVSALDVSNNPTTNDVIGVNMFIPDAPINYSLIPTVNNSLYWNGNLWSDTRWLNIDGSNANQNIDIGNYNISMDSGQIDEQLRVGIKGIADGGNWVFKQYKVGVDYPWLVPGAINDAFRLGFIEGGIYLTQFDESLTQFYLADRTSPFTKNFRFAYDDGTNYLALDSAGQTGSPQLRVTNMDITIRQDNKDLIFGAGEDSFTYWDGTNQLWNTTTGTLQIKNETGWGVIEYGDAVEHTFNETTDNPLETFINANDYEECEVMTTQTNTSDCWEVYDYTEYCFEEAICYDTWEEVPEKQRDYVEPINRTKQECSTYQLKGHSVGCTNANIRGSLEDLNRNVDLYENLTDFDTGIMVEEIYTQSKTIDVNEDYWDKFTEASLSNKATHKNVEVLKDINIPVEKRTVLNMENRTVDLEGFALKSKEKIGQLFDKVQQLFDKNDEQDARLYALETENELLKTALCKYHPQDKMCLGVGKL